MKVRNVGIDEVGLKVLTEFVAKVNKNSKRSIGRYNVLSYAVQLLSDKDIPKLQSKYYRPSDTFKVILEEINSENKDAAVDEEALMASMIEAFQAKRKTSKSLKAE